MRTIEQFIRKAVEEQKRREWEAMKRIAREARARWPARGYIVKAKNRVTGERVELAFNSWVEVETYLKSLSYLPARMRLSAVEVIPRGLYEVGAWQVQVYTVLEGVVVDGSD